MRTTKKGRGGFPGDAGRFVTFVLGCLLSTQSPAADTLTALAGMDGTLSLQKAGRELCRFHAGAFEPGWKFTGAARNKEGKLVINTASGVVIKCEAAFADKKDTKVHATYEFQPSADITLYSLHVSAEFAVPALAGGKWAADETAGRFPADFKDTHLFAGSIRILSLELPTGESLRLEFPTNTPVLLQDNRRWGPSFSIRIGPDNGNGMALKKYEPVKIQFSLATLGQMVTEYDGPVTIAAGPEWIPLKDELDIVIGSALDFSRLGLQDAPAGKHGWLQATPAGTFAFEKSPAVSRRFYGVNLCFSAFALSHEESDRLADRLVRLGYNAVRIHHYEGNLVEGQKTTLTFNTNRLDQFDYLMAALTKRGLYLTTDLLVSRPVRPAELDLDASTYEKWHREFKVLIPVHEPSFTNWAAFARLFLTHVNPYTGRAYAEEPALAWLSMINENNLGNYWAAIRDIPPWTTAWNAWLIEHYTTRASLAAAWGPELRDREDPAQGTVELPADLTEASLRTRDAHHFMTDTETRMFSRMKTFLREELKVKALLANMNGWTSYASAPFARTAFDYTDDHFYVDHPHFLEKDWRQPSRCPNTLPAGGDGLGRHVAFTRLMDKPFVLTEFNFAGPSRHRGIGGLQTGALGALQGWGGIWRFAYAHARERVTDPNPLNYFDLASDPINQASDRAGVLLFLRGDMREAPRTLTLAMTSNDLDRLPMPLPRQAPSWDWAAWVTRVGIEVVPSPTNRLAGDAVLPVGWATPAETYAQPKVIVGINPYAANAASILNVLRNTGLVHAGNLTDPGRSIFHSQTGELLVDGPRGVLAVDTPCTAGGFVSNAGRFSTRAGLAVESVTNDATVWAASLDGAPLATSRQILLAHLTDLQNTDARFGEKARQTLLSFGLMPHLVRAGEARITLTLRQPDALRVWALSPGGRRLAEIPSIRKTNSLFFTANVAVLAEQHGATMYYEVSAP